MQCAESKRGGNFIIPSGYGYPVTEAVFTPEQFTEEQRNVARMAREFVRGEFSEEVIRRIDAKEDGFTTTLELMQKAAQLSLKGIDVPETFGGPGLDFVTYMIVSEMMGCGSWAVTWGADVGIGTHPLLFFGTDAQRARYLPLLTSGEWISAFAATEPGAGSDLFSLKTTVVLDGDAYVLNGEKAFTTNAGFAKLFTVVACVDGNPKKSACFLVERSYPGVKIGREEHKLGIRGSSTCPVTLESVRVPKENLIGEVGRGMHIMLNVLNLGRLKLAVMTVGTAKRIITEALQYARERKQFNTPIANFGMTQEKFAQMIIRTWMIESAAYRTASLIDERIGAANLSDFAETLGALREYTIEAALCKVAGSELLWDVADEFVQIMGGYGYSTEYPAERELRDARINRIYEGTNEINRLAAILTLLEKAGKNELPLTGAGIKVKEELDEFAAMELATSFPEAQEQLVNNLKKIFLFAAGLFYKEFGYDKTALLEKQEALRRLSDMLIGIYVAESGLKRATQIGGEIPAAIVSVFVQQTLLQSEMLAKEILASLPSKNDLASYLGRLKRLARVELVDVVGLQRSIVQKLFERGAYFL